MKNESRSCSGCVSSRRAFVTGVTGALAIAASCEPWHALLGAAEVTAVAPLASGHSTATYAVPTKDGVSIDEKRQVILVRWQQKLFAFPLSCPHENTALKWKQKDGRFQCPKHESKYQPDGTFTSGRATRNMDRFGVSRNGDSVVVDLDAFYQSDTQAAQWATAMLQL